MGSLQHRSECPLYGKSFTQEPTEVTLRSLDKAKLGLRKEGLAFKKSAESLGLNEVVHKCASSMSKAIDTDIMVHEMTVEFLKSLSEKELEKLLKIMGNLSKGTEASSFSSRKQLEEEKQKRPHRQQSQSDSSQCKQSVFENFF